MSFADRLNYYRRVFAAYLTRSQSQLTFWHGEPQVNAQLRTDELGPYYMPFRAKADYAGQYDAQQIPLLDYHGAVGLQYNPIAIAQYGLGNYNCFSETGDPERRARFLRAAAWLLAHLEQNAAGEWVWNHYFDWEYRDTLRAPWYSALSQGQGLSLLLRAHQETGDDRYRDAAGRVLATFQRDVGSGGVSYVDGAGYTWFEEAIVDPPTHILNGFLWASWGAYDYWLYTGEARARHLFDEAVRTLVDNLPQFDIGFWSLYEQSGTRMKMLASPFYHRLHIVQLQVMHRLTGEARFLEYARRWQAYRQNRIQRNMALAYKAAFKLLYY